MGLLVLLPAGIVVLTAVRALWKWRGAWKVLGAIPFVLLLLLSGGVAYESAHDPRSMNGRLVLMFFTAFLGLVAIFLLVIHSLIRMRNRA